MNHSGLALSDVARIHFSINLCRLCKWDPNNCEERRMIEVLNSDVEGYSLNAAITTFLNITVRIYETTGHQNKQCK